MRNLPAVSFSYSGADSQEVLMNINRSGNKKHGGTFKCNSMEEITPNQMRLSQLIDYLDSPSARFVLDSISNYMLNLNC